MRGVHDVLAAMAAAFTIAGIVAGDLELRAAHRAYSNVVARVTKPSDPDTHPLASYDAMREFGPMFEALYRGNVPLRIAGAASLLAGVLLTLAADLIT